MRLSELRNEMEKYSTSFDASAVTATDAARGLRDVAAIKNMAATLEGKLAARVADTELWRLQGDRSPAHALARQSGTTVGQAMQTLETARRLEELPALAAAAARGEVSAQQSAAISAAAAADPSAERRLLGHAKSASLAELREECDRTKAAAAPDLEALRKKVHDERFLRSFKKSSGAARIEMEDNPEVVAQIMATIEAITDKLFHRARRAGTRDRREAYAADALLELATAKGSASGTKARAKIIFRIDWTAWLRGYPSSGEVAELVGYGPVAVSAVADAIDAGGFVGAVIVNGAQLAGVAHLGRKPTALQQTALEWLYPSCAAMGCAQVARLQTDHRVDWADAHITMLDWLDGLCDHHHDLKTRLGWGLADGTGKRAFVAPDDPRHPANAHAPPVAAM